MGMREASPKITPCEIYRTINDMCQGDDGIEIRRLCTIGEREAKRLAQELNKYKKEAWTGWWPINPGWRKKFEKRLKKEYKVI